MKYEPPKLIEFSDPIEQSKGLCATGSIDIAECDGHGMSASGDCWGDGVSAGGGCLNGGGGS
jgi:hypothetical protein